jgi:hydroxymethylpyrimidine pyrophosphatase-like HAD family hydrolase
MESGLARLRERYDAILLDLDGTLLDGEARLTPRTVKAVQALRDAGFFVVLCTGRSVLGTQRIHQGLGLTTPMIAYNGAWIGHAEGPPLRYRPIAREALASVFSIESRAYFSFRHHRERKYTVMTPHPEHERVARWYEAVVRVDHESALPDDDLLRVSIFFDERDFGPGEGTGTLWWSLPEAERSRLRLESFPLRIFPEYRESSLLLFEVQAGGEGKAEAFDWLLAEHGIPAERTIAVGDQSNDVTMLARAGLAVAMANAIPEALRHAHLVIGHHAEEGVAAWIEQGAPVLGERPRGERG